MARFKTGRLADQDERDIVAELVKLYRQAQASPDGRVCVNPEDDPEEQTNIYADDVDYLLYVLEGFVQTGTFKNTDRHGFADMFLRGDLDRLKKTGMGYTEAVNALAERHHCSPRTIERRLNPTKRDTDCR